MTVVGLDDTDSRDRGSCTTAVATRLATALQERGHRVRRPVLVRCNPAVPHKTRGNAAVAVPTDAPPAEALAVARSTVSAHAVTDDPDTSPGVVVAPNAPTDVPDDVAEFARAAVRDRLDVADAERRLSAHDYRSAAWDGGRGRIGALAAVGARAAFSDWTVELIAYRRPDRVGTDREVDRAALFAAADAHYPAAWDTVDRGAGEAVCVPHTPGPVLYGIRGDDPGAVRAVASAAEDEPVAGATLFRTNQGTDAHLRSAAVGEVRDGRAYRVSGEVVAAPETREGGHVFLTVAADGDRLDCVAFEPTKRFRDRVRALRAGDRITVCGEVSDGTLKLEKFAVRDLVRTAPATPTCPDCGRTMESAGADAGYRCRDCDTATDGPASRRLDRALQRGWYEVPPRARRHVAKPLVRGGFDAPVHPER
ncbi:MAG: DUF1743 domain-containing protein [Halobacteriaceae archaeon]